MTGTVADKTLRTSRGFVIYDEFHDLYRARVWVQQSSSATRKATWVFVEGGDTNDNHGAIHLDRSQVRRLRKALKEALKR